MNPVKHLSRAVKFGNTIYVAGTVGRDLRSGKMGESISEQSKIALENVKLTLEAAGASMADILKMTVYLVDINDKKVFDEVYMEYFPSDPPARACFAVADLGAGVKIEIESIAGISD